MLARAQNPEPTNVLGVFGMSGQTNHRDLEKEFSKFGKVENVQLINDKATQRSRGPSVTCPPARLHLSLPFCLADVCELNAGDTGFGFVYFETVDQAAKAREAMNGATLDGRKVRVDYSVRITALRRVRCGVTDSCPDLNPFQVTQKAHPSTPGRYLGTRKSRSRSRERPRSRPRSRSPPRRSRSRSRSRGNRLPPPTCLSFYV